MVEDISGISVVPLHLSFQAFCLFLTFSFPGHTQAGSQDIVLSEVEETELTEARVKTAKLASRHSSKPGSLFRINNRISCVVAPGLG